ncbi:branched-chain amino acid ABC transporter permease [Candidatus Bathyarchaeota archaeon]|nr:MAG: branched-chain amino acid ABC transporter permease [Candidatus Bathyarchaeota archaeon]HDN63051.1 branched-chain amino acid ABC transporter permease [Candidatus Bathyarchaeota archaeon]
MTIPAQALFVIDLLATFSIYVIIALSLNLEYGYAGIPNFGKVLSVAGGAFTVGFFPGRLLSLMLKIDPKIDYATHSHEVVTIINNFLEKNVLLSLGIFFATLLVACVVGAILGFIASYPAIRLREDYLAITLLAMGEAIRIIGYNYTPIVGGTLGVMVPDPFRWSGGLRYVTSTLFISLIALIVFLYLERLVRTPLGRTLKAIRENEDVARSLGKDVTRIRTKTIMVSSVIAAVGGALYAFHSGNVHSLTYHRASWTFWPWVMVILGGAGNNVGVILGTFIFVSVRKFIIFYKGYLSPFLPFDVVWLDLLLLGLALIIIQMYRPQGLLPEKPTPTISFDKIRELYVSKKDET